LVTAEAFFVERAALLVVAFFDAALFFATGAAAFRAWLVFFEVAAFD
jgi:hypothetical protein